MTIQAEPLEVLDVLWDVEMPSGDRLPVHKADARAKLEDRGQQRAARMLDGLPVRKDGTLEEVPVDQVFLAVHLELARLSEFVHVPQRMASSLAPIVAQLRDDAGGTIRVVDVGCGIGFDTRVLAATRALGPDVEFVGLDFNSLLVDAAARLARAEDIPVRFIHGDALDPSLAIDDPARTLMISSGVLHHIGRDSLGDFFARHGDLGVAGFAHFDPSPGFWTHAGAWMLHRTRMREPISRHDGSMSMRRALSAQELLDSATARIGDDYELTCEDVSRYIPQPEKIVRPIVGRRR
ncbi:class I SAM-dependent methyltransferase [Demequina muriae]|uniref:Class I SAM-dependent methyltransferase n=1 Tax=Demequina muriae TaxID=3051664 RepID=A0ABT8GDZ7_9MICO|nr:class I SAM-dependent methyltransferase [Demequina sp. EGI L300058]MDN4479652.1 class I SAM-dependent methyltransferase [Demequina sp. EGI L300058]